MLFLTQFDVYLYLILPLTVVLAAVITTYTSAIFGDMLGCELLLENYEFK